MKAAHDDVITLAGWCRALVAIWWCKVYEEEEWIWYTYSWLKHDCFKAFLSYLCKDFKAFLSCVDIAASLNLPLITMMISLRGLMINFLTSENDEWWHSCYNRNIVQVIKTETDDDVSTLKAALKEAAKCQAEEAKSGIKPGAAHKVKFKNFCAINNMSLKKRNFLRFFFFSFFSSRNKNIIFSLSIYQ